MSNHRRALGFFGGTVSLLATSLAHGQCSKDTDCKADRVCDAGSCVSPGSAPATPLPAVAPPAPVGAGETTADSGTPSIVPPTRVSPPQPKLQRHSEGMMVGGIVMVSLAPVALAVASVSALGKALCGVDDYDPNRSCDGYDPAIYGSLLSALVLAGVGIPLIIVGAKKEPVDPPAVSATLAPWATPTSVGLGLRLQL